MKKILLITAIGCPDITPAPDSHIKRSGDKLTIYCNNTGDTRHLVCSRTQWVGEVINCTGGLSEINQITD